MSPLLVPLHGVGTRRDLPLPFELVVAGAAVTLVVTFALLLWAWRTPRHQRPGGVPLPRLTRVLDARATRVLAGVLVWAAYLWFGLALVGGKDLVSNPVFGWVFVCLWVGLVPVSLLLGGVWRELHPAWTLATLLRRDPRERPEASTRRRLARLGVWPAVVALVGFAWLELCQPHRATQPVLAWFVAAYWVWVLGGALLLGRGWVPAADPFTAYADLVARLSPWQRIDGVLHLVNPLRHVGSTRPVPGAIGVVAVLLGATFFDSFSNSSAFIGWAQHSGLPPAVASGLGLAAFLAAVALTLAIGVAGLRPLVDGARATDVALTFAPIVAGYALGHYASLLAVEGQRTLIHASDPLGLGWNAFGTAELGVNTFLFDHPTVIAVLQLVAIVGGHVLGVLTAHDKALALLRPSARLRGQLPLLAVMVGYTCVGLLLLFAE